MKFLKQNTPKAGEIFTLAEKMREITRPDDRMIKRPWFQEIPIIRYKEWKQHIWADLEEDRKLLEDYVPDKGESKPHYD